MRHAVILAGGSGTRLWPASRRSRPKQLLPLGPGGEPLLAAAVRRGRAVAGDRVMIVTALEQVEATRAAMPDVEILVEPVGRNTAAAIGLAGAVLAARDPEASLVVLPADQHVRDEAGLERALVLGLEATEHSNVIGTVGITPTRPETGFGYLEVADVSVGEPMVVPVLHFVEKPDRATAERYIASGRYLWNAGMFFLTARRLLEELESHLPATASAVRAIAAAGKNAQDVASGLYPALPSISFDHGVMEKASGVVTIPASVGWDDVGSWAALSTVRGLDAAGNTVDGETIVIDGSGNILISDDETIIATVGLSDMVVVKSGGAILVIRKDQAQDVRKVVDALSARGLTRYL